MLAVALADDEDRTVISVAKITINLRIYVSSYLEMLEECVYFIRNVKIIVSIKNVNIIRFLQIINKIMKKIIISTLLLFFCFNDVNAIYEWDSL
jgi:hypothetical protein